MKIMLYYFSTAEREQIADTFVHTKIENKMVEIELSDQNSNGIENTIMYTIICDFE